MENTCFDSFNARQFVDFSQDDQLDDRDSNPDIFFKEESASPLSSKEYTQTTTEMMQRSTLRKSISVDNLEMFYERAEEDYDSRNRARKIVNQPNLKATQSLRENSNILKQKENAKNLPSRGTFNKGSMNQLAQPKRFGSVENLKNWTANAYIPLAEAVNQFQTRTPTRFRSKPNLIEHAFKPLSVTIPASPALQTKNRARPEQHHILSHTERELIEFENSQKLKIKAHPVNKKILHGPVKPLEPVEKKPVTVPQPFNITQVPPKKVAPSPEKFVFHAQPIMKGTEKPQVRAKIQHREQTKPVTPSFMKNYVPPSFRMNSGGQNDKQLAKTPKDKPRLTMFQPFSFDKRDKGVAARKQAHFNRVLEEERKAREFHANPVPKFICKKDPATAQSDIKVIRNCTVTSSVENLTTQFKAQPATVLSKEPFIVAKNTKPLTEVQPFQLEGELRYQQRMEFESQLKLRREIQATIKNSMEEEQEKREKEEILKLRKQAEYKAQPIRKFKELKIQPTGKVTVPMSPKFHSRKTAVKENNFL
ncbi:targeting protein for Xklp2 homolog isoform X2 [Euwallacea similis]|uniref:targeting protein for Xklp2 homolog isoform X2 n=1 Tax=Euwallacea similis TaxID=1736056 RepID=UPI00344B693E